MTDPYDSVEVADSDYQADELNLLAAESDLLDRRLDDRGHVVWESPDGALTFASAVPVTAGSTEHKSTLSGPAGPVGPTLTKADTNEIDMAALPDRFQTALQAEDFIIYGKASIEQYDSDDVATLIEMDALEGALDRFFESEMAPGIISRYHQDIPVGRPVREYTLDEARTVEVGEETYEFAAGDTLTTHVEDADGDAKPELWLASNIANDTEVGKRTRIKALTGDLDGYSVTIHRNDDEVTQEGRRVTSCDLHAVTLGTDEQIKNKGSEFGVAEFKAALASRLPDDAQGASLAEGLAEVIMAEDDDETLSARLREKMGLKAETDDAQPDETPADDTESKAGDDLEQIAQMIAEATGVEPEEALAMLDDMAAADSESEDGELKADDVPPDGDDDDEDDEEEDEEEDAEEKGEQPDVEAVIEAKLDERLDSLVTAEDVEAKLDERLAEVATEEDLAEAKADLAEAVGEEVEGVMQKAEVGSTPDPSTDEESSMNTVGDIVSGAGGS